MNTVRTLKFLSMKIIKQLKKKYDPFKVSKEDIVKNELKISGVNPETLGYKIILSMVQFDALDTINSYDDLINMLSIILKRPERSIKSAMMYLIRTADFSKSTYDGIKSLSEYRTKDAMMNIHKWIKNL